MTQTDQASCTLSWELFVAPATTYRVLKNAIELLCKQVNERPEIIEPFTSFDNWRREWMPIW